MARWYDNNPQATEVFNLIQSLDEASQQILSDNIIHIVNQIKNVKKENVEKELSLGLDRVLGLYKSSNARRWYDQNSELSNAIRMLSAQPEEDFNNIMEGLYNSLKEATNKE